MIMASIVRYTDRTGLPGSGWEQVMKRKIKLKQLIIVFFGLCATLPDVAMMAQDRPLPFTVQSGLFDYSRSGTLGLDFAPDTRTCTIFQPRDSTDKYSHGVVLVAFRGCLYAQWQSSSRDEDAPDTRVVYSRSSDGYHWTKPMILASVRDEGICTGGGWWTNDSMLVAYINVWPRQQNPKGGFTEYTTSTDGMTWSDRKPLLDIRDEPVSGIFEQDPHALPDGRIISAIHEQPGLNVAPYYTDDPSGIRGWTRGFMKNLPFEGTTSREMEPGWFCQADGTIVMIFRDQAGSFRNLASVSRDRGQTWSMPVMTGMPDSRSKQCAGNFPDGTAFMVNNPVKNKNRIPLVITLSKDGRHFDRAFLLRKGGADLQPLRYQGRYKSPGYSYPKAIIWNHFLYVSYATNKEDVELTRVPLASLVY